MSGIQSEKTLLMPQVFMDFKSNNGAKKPKNAVHGYFEGPLKLRFFMTVVGKDTRMAVLYLNALRRIHPFRTDCRCAH